MIAAIPSIPYTAEAVEAVAHKKVSNVAFRKGKVRQNLNIYQSVVK